MDTNVDDMSRLVWHCAHVNQHFLTTVGVAGGSRNAHDTFDGVTTNLVLPVALLNGQRLFLVLFEKYTE
jgi:hypothetical protein